MVDEQLGHGDAEQLRHAQCERQTGIIFVGFDRVDGLARNPEPPGKLALAPAAFLAQPWLLLGEFEDEIKDLGPFGERGGGLEEDRGLDDCFRAEEATEMVIALFLYTRIISD